MIRKPENLYTILDEAVKKKLSPFLKEKEFRKKGHSWNRNRNDFIDVVELQVSSKCSSDNYIRFTLNFGICIPSIVTKIFEQTKIENNHFAKEAICIIRARPGELSLNPENLEQDFWWKVNSKEEVEKAFEEIENLLKTKAIPYLEYFDSMQKIEEYLLQKPRPYTSYDFGRIQIAILLAMNGKPDAARELLRSIINAEIGWKEEAAQVAEKLCLTL